MKQRSNGNFFSLPSEIFLLGLRPGELAVYSYLRRCEDRGTHQCWPSYKTIGKAVGMSENTVRLSRHSGAGRRMDGGTGCRVGAAGQGAGERSGPSAAPHTAGLDRQQAAPPGSVEEAGHGAEAEPRHRPTADHVVTRPPSKIASQNKDKTLCPEGKCEIFDNSSPTAWLFYRRCSMLCC